MFWCVILCKCIDWLTIKIMLWCLFSKILEMNVCTVFNLHGKKLCILNMTSAAVATENCPNYSKSIWHMTQHHQRLSDGTRFQFYGTL